MNHEQWRNDCLHNTIVGCASTRAWRVLRQRRILFAQVVLFSTCGSSACGPIEDADSPFDRVGVTGESKQAITGDALSLTEMVACQIEEECGSFHGGGGGPGYTCTGVFQYCSSLDPRCGPGIYSIQPPGFGSPFQGYCGAANTYGERYLLILSYNHVAGQNPALYAAATPPTDLVNGYSHLEKAKVAALLQAGAYDVKMECSTNAHTRVMNVEFTFTDTGNSALE